MKKIKNVVFLDFFSVGNFHEIISSCMAEIFLRGFNSVTIKGSYSFCETLSSNVQYCTDNPKNRFNYHTLRVFEGQTPLGALIRMFCGLFIVLYEYFKTPKDSLLYLNYNNFFAFPVLLCFNRFLRKKIVIIQHGELEYPFKKIAFYKPYWLYGRLNSFSFRYLLNKSNVNLLLLGDSIRENFIRAYPMVDESSLIVINHPYKFTNISYGSIMQKSNSKIIVGTIGYLNSGKGLYTYCDLVDYFASDILADKIEFRHIGRVEPGFKTENHTNIMWSSSYLPRDIFNSKISELDYILFLYPKYSYQFTASGALLDAISFEKPILALANSYFQYVLSTELLASGLVSSIDDLVLCLKSIINNKDSINATRLKSEFGQIKDRFSVDSVFKSFMSQL